MKSRHRQDRDLSYAIVDHADIRGLSPPDIYSLLLVIVTLGFFLIVGVGAWLISGRVAAQAEELAEKLPRAIENLSA